MTLELSKKTLASLGLLLILSPVFALAQSGSTNTNTGTTNTSGTDTGIAYECSPPGECTFNDLLEAIKRVTKWGSLFALGFSVIVIAWAGFNYMISGSNPGKRSEANSMLQKVVIGIAFILLAWLIVTLITNALIDPAKINTFLK